MQVTAENLHKRFGSKRVLAGIDLDLPAGSIVALVGVNGAGKTTLLHALAGLLALDRGEVRFAGEAFRRDRLDLRRRLLFLPDFPCFVLARTLIEHLGLLLRLYERNPAAETERILGLLGDFDLLPIADQPLHSFSRGQGYKAALVALLAVAPELWLLDEPLASGMDPLGLRAFQNHARTAAEAGHTILFTTQILEVAERFADYAAILHDGRIRAFAPCSELRTAGRAGGLNELFAQLTEPAA
jgi:ABC-type multidrug transport system ATPase subunit